MTKSYVKDTSHFLHLTKDMIVNDSEILYTVEVMALYTNITHQNGIEKEISFMRKKGATTAEIELCKEILGCVLRKNYFEFNNKFFKDIRYCYGNKICPQLCYYLHG